MKILAGGQAEAVLEQRLGHVAGHDLAVGEDRLQVHGLPQRAGFDIFDFQGQADVLAGSAKSIGIDGEGGLLA